MPEDLRYLKMLDPEDLGYRRAMLEVRSFIAHHGKDEVDQFCMQALADMRIDAENLMRKLGRG